MIFFKGEGHYWDTVMNAPVIQSFYDNYINKQLPSFPLEFSVVTMNPDTTG